MLESHNIRFLRHHEIDMNKWDDCIQNSFNGLIYAYSFYLDHMAKNWDGLVLGDYDTVMPLTWNRKFGIKYLYQPFLTAQLGVYRRNPETMQAKEFIQAIPFEFKFLDINLNTLNVAGIGEDQVQIRNNYVLKLSGSYDQLYNNYNENIRRNIKKAYERGCKPVKDFDVEKVIGLALEQMKAHSTESKNSVGQFRKLYTFLRERNMAATYGIENANAELIASCVFFFSHNRAYYILVGNHPDSKNMGASHALIDSFIKENAGRNMILDFEGSDIRSLAQFYAGFGARQETYPSIRINRLPFYLKWLK